jgi:hypothetical protein
MEPLRREMPVSRAFFYITFRFPGKGALSAGSRHRAPTERESHFISRAILYPSPSPW